MAKPKSFPLADALGSSILYRQLEDVYNSNGKSRVGRVEDLVAMGRTVSQAQGSVARDQRANVEHEAAYCLFQVAITPETRNSEFPEIEVSATQNTLALLTSRFEAVASTGSRLALPFAKMAKHMMIHAPHTVTQAAVNHLVPAILVNTEQIVWDDRQSTFPLPDSRIALVAELKTIRDMIAPGYSEAERAYVNRTIVERAISPGEYTEIGVATNPGVYPNVRASFLNACYATNRAAFTPAHLKALRNERARAEEEMHSSKHRVGLLGFA